MKEDNTEAERKRISDIFFALDLGFSDGYNDENVRQLTLQNKLGEIEIVVDIVILDDAINYSLFCSRGETHPVADIYVNDFPSDLRASIYLLLGGYYRQAILCIRNWLEIRMCGIYYGFVEKDISKYTDWKNGNLELFGKNLIRHIFSNANFHKVPSLRNDLDTLYEKLSAFVHGGGISHFNLQKDSDNVPRYNEHSVMLWLSYIKPAFMLISVLHFIAFGSDAIRELTVYKIKKIKGFIDDKYWTVIEPYIDIN